MEKVVLMSTTHGPRKRLHIGEDVCYDVQHSITAVLNSGHVRIGDECTLGYGIKFLCGWHDYTLKGKRRHACPQEGFDIRVHRGVWIASYVIIIGPVEIGEDAVIGAGSVVLPGKIPAGELWAGNPARKIKDIKFKEASDGRG